jgi:hypothetical protein
MKPAISTDDIEALARRRVGMKLGFYIHLLVYAVVNLGLFTISTLSGRGNWHVWPMMGWGLGLAIHGLVTFIGLRGEGVRQRMIADEVERLRRNP